MSEQDWLKKIFENQTEVRATAESAAALQMAAAQLRAVLSMLDKKGFVVKDGDRYLITDVGARSLRGKTKSTAAEPEPPTIVTGTAADATAEPSKQTKKAATKKTAIKKSAPKKNATKTTVAKKDSPPKNTASKNAENRSTAPKREARKQIATETTEPRRYHRHAQKMMFGPPREGSIIFAYFQLFEGIKKQLKRVPTLAECRARIQAPNDNTLRGSYHRWVNQEK